MKCLPAGELARVLRNLADKVLKAQDEDLDCRVLDANGNRVATLKVVEE